MVYVYNRLRVRGDEMNKVIQASRLFGSANFEIGSSYFCRSVCGHDCVWIFDVIGRTEKTITLFSKSEGEVKRKVSVNSEGVEYVKPFGSYSMSPILVAR